MPTTAGMPTTDERPGTPVIEEFARAAGLVATAETKATSVTSRNVTTGLTAAKETNGTAGDTRIDGNTRIRRDVNNSREASISSDATTAAKPQLRV